MQVNHLAHFLLTNLLMETLVDSKASVINTSSVANKFFSDLDVDDLDLANRYTQRRAYGNAKLENILFTKELHRRYHDRGISTAAFHPGNVATNFASETNSLMRFVYHTPLRKIALISPAKGADTLVWLSTTTAGHDWQSGEYYVRRKASTNLDKKATNPDLARQLWEQSEKYCVQ